MVEPAAILEQLHRDPDDHKGRFGHVLVLGGSTGFVGAACLAAQAALRSGAGLVTLGVPRSLLPVAATKLTSCMTRPFREVPDGAFALGALPAIRAAASRHNVVALGPGIGRHRSTEKLVHAVLRSLDCPIVLDADGLNALEGHVDLLKDVRTSLVLTPHPGEMSRLTGLATREIQSRRADIARSFASEHGVNLILKGHRTVVTDGHRMYENRTGNPGMATGGTGDVLTGVVAGLLAQGLEPFPAACVATHLHGLAGDIAAARLGQIGVTAEALLNHLPTAFLAAAQTNSTKPSEPEE